MALRKKLRRRDSGIMSSEPDGRIDVINTCHKGSRGWSVEVARAWRRVMEQSGNARLKVKIRAVLGPFRWGDYWISASRARPYSAVLVGDPSGSNLWILARRNLSTRDPWRGSRPREALGYETGPLGE